MKYLFPFSLVKQGSDVVLYGAGYVGYDYYRQVLISGYCKTVLWVDKQYQWYQDLGMPVFSPESLFETYYDVIVIAVKEERTYLAIKKWLNGRGVLEEKIIWHVVNEWQCDIAPKYDKERIIRESKTAFIVDPKMFLSPDRLDLVIRLRYARDLINNHKGSESEMLYEKLIRTLPDEEEPTYDYMMAYFTGYSQKHGIESFKQSYADLIHSMVLSGFSNEDFVPIDVHNQLINGAHRIAAAIALGEKVWVRKYNFDGFHYDFSARFLLENGFDINDVDSILKELEDLTHAVL